MMLSPLSCQKGMEDNGTIGNAAFELSAQLPQTRTTLLHEEGFRVQWNKNDQLAVFNAPTGTADYSENLHFFIDDEATGKFTAGEGVQVPFEGDVNYDWFVCSPYRATNGNVELKSPKGQSGEDGYFPIGAATQTGYNNSEHIASSDIMVGKVTNTRTPSVKLQHLAVLHKFTVTNKSNMPIVVTKLTFNGGENKLFGTFWIDMTSDNPAIDITKANATFNERALTVRNGEELAINASADFYVMTAPFTLNAGEVFKVTIETSIGSQVVEKTAPEDIVFAAGTYNTANLEFNYQQTFADHLYLDTFGVNSSLPTTGNSSTQFTDNTMTSRWNTYLNDMTGLSVYDGTSSVSYSWNNVQLSAQVAATAIKGMEDTYLWFKDTEGSQLTISGIELYGKTALTFSFVQAYNASSVKVEYSVDAGQTWTDLGTVINTSADAVVRSFDFNLQEEAETISIRLTRLAKAPRIDNVKLTWQQVE